MNPVLELCFSLMGFVSLIIVLSAINNFGRACKYIARYYQKKCERKRKNDLTNE